MGRLDFHGKEERPWTGPRLRNAAIVGHTTESTARIWVRCRLAAEHRLIVCSEALSEAERDPGDRTASAYASDLGDKVVFNKKHDFQNDTDRTYVFDVKGLKSGIRYHYYVITEKPGIDPRMVLGRQVQHTFKTMDNGPSLTFGLYSCHDPFKKRSDAAPWRHFHAVLEKLGADMVVGGGDQVYVDCSETDIWKWLKKIKRDLLKEKKADIRKIMLSWYQDVYRGYWGFPDVQRVFRSFPNYMIWDDHEIMDGWGSRTRAELSDTLDTWYEWENRKANLMLADSMFEAAKTVYHQYQHGHNPKTAKGVFDFSFGQKHAAFYFMDMRGQREFDLKRLRKREKDAKATDRILGKKQIKRILAWLKAIPDETRMVYIVSPVPVVHWTGFAVNTGDVFGAKDDFRDEWDHETNHRERDKILKAVFSFSGKTGVPVAFLSGDVHMSAVFRLTHGSHRKARVFQITSSPITRPPAPGIADIILSDNGSLKSGKKDTDYRFHRLAKFHTRNFCILNSQPLDGGGLDLYVDFYGETESRDEMRRKRVRLT